MLTTEECAAIIRHRPKVTGVESDGEYLDVEFTNENGERVWANQPD